MFSILNAAGLGKEFNGIPDGFGTAQLATNFFVCADTRLPNWWQFFHTHYAATN